MKIQVKNCIIGNIYYDDWSPPLKCTEPILMWPSGKCFSFKNYFGFQRSDSDCPGLFKSFNDYVYTLPEDVRNYK